MAQGEFFEIFCAPSPYGTDNTADNYSCTGINPNTGVPYNLCNGFSYTGEKCNVVSIVDTPTMLVNDDYSVTFTIPIPATTPVYTPAWYTCEGWLNPAYASTVTTPDLSSITITIKANYGSGTGQVETQNITIAITDPGDLTVVGGNWTYTTDPCQFSAYGQYNVGLALVWDYASSPVVANTFGCYSYTYLGAGFSDRPPIGLEVSLGINGSGGGQLIGGTLTPYDTGAGCVLMAAPNTNGSGRPRRNRVR